MFPWGGSRSGLQSWPAGSHCQVSLFAHLNRKWLVQTASSSETVENVSVRQKESKYFCYCRWFCSTFKIPSGQEEFGRARDALTFAQCVILVMLVFYVHISAISHLHYACRTQLESWQSWRAEWIHGESRGSKWGKGRGTNIKLTRSDIHNLDLLTVSSSSRLPWVWWLKADFIHTLH